MSTLQTNKIQHLTSGFNNIVTHTDGAGTVNAAHCRVWVNFNGTGTVAINAQFNVSSITDNGTGDYTVNFSNALADANYVTGTIGNPGYSFITAIYDSAALPTASALRITTRTSAFSVTDNPYTQIAVFR